MRYKQWKIAHPSPEGRAQLERAGIPPFWPASCPPGA